MLSLFTQMFVESLITAFDIYPLYLNKQYAYTDIFDLSIFKYYNLYL